MERAMHSPYKHTPSAHFCFEFFVTSRFGFYGSTFDKKLPEAKVCAEKNISGHSSEIRGLRSTKCSSETLQNLLYFMYKKIHVVFFVFHFMQLYIFTL